MPERDVAASPFCFDAPFSGGSLTAEVQRLDWPVFHTANITVDMLRLDLLDPHLGGNKWYKLKHHLIDARAKGCKKILSFGGAHSNHLYALAKAGQRFGFDTIGVIRGFEPKRKSPTQSDLCDMGMQLEYVSYSEYAKRYSADWLQALQARMGPVYMIPEGGASELALAGVAQMIPLPLMHCYDTIALATGTGATAAGVIHSIASVSTLNVDGAKMPSVLGVSALCDGGSTEQRIRQMLQAGLQAGTGMSDDCTPDSDCLGGDTLGGDSLDGDNDGGIDSLAHWQVDSQWACGGFAKLNAELVAFMDAFTERTQILLDPVYTAKLMFALSAMAAHGGYSAGHRILAVHSGGLQGLRAMAGRISRLRGSAD